MRKVSVTIAAGLAALSLGGCVAKLGADVVATRDFFADPKTQVLLSEVKQGAIVFICGVSTGAKITSDVIQATAVDPTTGKPLSEGAKARITKSGYIAADSDGACRFAGGVVAGTVPAKTATPAISATAS